jgi:hypothetical protein
VSFRHLSDSDFGFAILIMPKTETKPEKKGKHMAVESESETELPVKFMNTIDHLINSFTDSMNMCIDKLTKAIESSLSQLIEVHRAQMKDVNDHVFRLESRLSHLEASSLNAVSRQHAPEQGKTWADLVTAPSYPLPQINNSTSTGGAPKILIGSKISDSIKSVPCPLVVFVGRLVNETSVSELSDYLAVSGIPSSKCVKLLSKDPTREFHSSAFRVSCDEKFRSIIFSDTTWPEGAEVRDWFFKK